MQTKIANQFSVKLLARGLFTVAVASLTLVGCGVQTPSLDSAQFASASYANTGLYGSVSLNISANIPTLTGTTVSGVTSQSEAMPMLMNHTFSGMAGTLSSNCAACHAGSASGNYKGGQFHGNFLIVTQAQPTSCMSCHSGARPLGFVGPVATSRSPASGEMRHEAVAWTNQGGNWVATSTPLVTQDCAICHQAPGVRWSGTQFHNSLNRAGLAQPGSCLDCHANTRPPGGAGANNYSHVNNGGLGDCVMCHGSKVAASSNNFTTWVNTGN